MAPSLPTATTDTSATQTLCPSDVGAFHPAAGSLKSASDRFENEAREYLRCRLRMTTFVLFAGFLGFLLLALPQAGSESLGLHAAVTVLLGALAGLFLTKWSPSTRVLRGVEIVVFGVTAAFFVVSRYLNAMGVPPPLVVVAEDRVRPFDLAFLSELAIPWILLGQLYGVFIPNTWKRATAMVAAMSLTPVVLALVIAVRREDVADQLRDGGFVALLLWMTISAVIAIYGSHRFGLLRREAFDAKQLGAYSLREMLGAGGMGEVYLAEHRLLKRPAAIKLIRPEKAGDANALARFEGEVQATAALTHPNTVEIYDYGHALDGTFYYVMEYLPGLNLQDLVDRYGPLPAERAVFLMTQVCSALREAHAAGLIHRDVKPGNIYACERGGLFDVAKLLDFGLVKSIRPDSNQNLTFEGAVVGSPHFAAPEAMLDGDLDARADIYSLGATLYFLLTGRPVFPEKNILKVIFAHQNEAVTPLSLVTATVPADLEAVVLKCLEKKSKARFESVAALEEALRSCQCAGRWTQAEAAEWWTSTGETAQAGQDTGFHTSTATAPVRENAAAL